MARFLDIEPSFFSKILAGRRNPSPETIARLGTKLGASDAQIQSWLAQYPMVASDAFRELPTGDWDGVSGWEHFAILSLIRTQDFKSESTWIARRLGIPNSKVIRALERLESAHLIKRTRAGIIRRAAGPVKTTQDLSSAKLRLSHRESLTQAIHCLKAVPVEFRDITSITMPIDPARISEAKARIKKFRRSLCTYLESGKKTEVYNLNVQLVPVTKVRNPKRKKI